MSYDDMVNVIKLCGWTYDEFTKSSRCKKTLQIKSFELRINKSFDVKKEINSDPFIKLDCNINKYLASHKVI